ncbi:MAG: DNA gyrase subunit B [Candidatus Harrisonbacteria bacterium RIFCSPHIGHO2_01_FULL_44_13]|uniref:DNA topoisomerase (ATP-hydrolyzing) n=1 Tax=Candidatus Harrisonbacteria bacterium RIFCSPLOWO2_01_FULL_44_18 TaxID=1798407 RepID=A0A1G1ZKP6_9BACT|nr:MAG: DNA gyrase subunit B [Candidatus Harrisonbacteria bacterium RIFCSPHIGHO2_01_FULL_44_13]OGY65198.1 MAG: DNA gyrase subunit B [Candidatus Harrisonbacteria bacterium RIFCSPLOWO2_01_FULL_44_18]
MAKTKAKKASKNEEKQPSYTAKDIYVLEGLEPVRKRPGMYIGTTDVAGLHHLIYEVVDNSIDEAMAGYAKNIQVEFLPGNRIAVTDDGRGIPVEIHKQTKKSALETVMTTLHAGGKFGGESYKVSGGLHGVGVSVVCALSKWMKAEVCRDKGLYVQEYERGKPQYKVKKIAKCDSTGTKVTFEPDPEIFKTIEFDRKRVLDHLRQQAFLTKGARIEVIDIREKTPFYHAFYFDGGLLSFIKFLNRSEKPLQETPFYINKTSEGVEVEAVFTYNNELEIQELSFANNIYTPDGGMHLTGFRSALTRTLNDYARGNDYVKKDEDNLTGDDVREGLVAIVSVKIREPQFEGQTKARLGNSEARTAVEGVIGEALKEFLERNSVDARRIMEKCLLAAKARKAAKAAKETVLRKGILEGLTLPGKLADCSSRNPEESELFIVEGDSAGGCFFGETKVALLDGRNISFKDLVEEEKKGKKNFCYTIKKDGHIGVAPILNPRITRQNAKVAKVILDNGQEIICTPGHKFMLRDGTFREAKDLNCRDSLMPLYRKKSEIGGRITIDGYEMVYNPKENFWRFTHVLSDGLNLENKTYFETNGPQRHHKDFNKLNNNPNNITRLSKEDHFRIHQEIALTVLRSPEVLEKLRKIRQSPEYRNRISKKMREPRMRAILSERAKKQWENENYKKFMAQKFLGFYKNNEEYRNKNKKLLYKSQMEYWNNEDNRKKQAERVRNYFHKNLVIRSWLSQIAKQQWDDSALIKWRANKTKEQWTQAFRIKRSMAYSKTYKEKALKLLKELFDGNGKIEKGEYTRERLIRKDKSILRYETICERFFDSDENKLKEAVINYNHKIKAVIPLEEKMDVYDIEVPNTHNFALASGVFVHNSSKQGRDRRTQAILPLKGKILNVEKSRIDKMLLNKEIKALVVAIGTAIAESFDINKLRYHKVILMTDADVDGSHIRTLLLTLFYRYFPQIIDEGHLYIAQPPLYRVQKGKEISYIYREEEREKLPKEGINLQRYKGLGEMNPEQLWETTMDPAKRALRIVKVDDVEEADRMFDVLMGEDVEPRKNFIQAHALSVKNFDI